MLTRFVHGLYIESTIDLKIYFRCAKVTVSAIYIVTLIHVTQAIVGRYSLKEIRVGIADAMLF
jgi:hypothetical protein